MKRALAGGAIAAVVLVGAMAGPAFAGEVGSNGEPTPIKTRDVAGSICAFSGQNDDPTGGGDPFQAGQTQNWGHTLAVAKQLIGDGDNGANELASMINAEGPGTNCRGFASGD
jgi:hypothetical protein